MVKRNVVLAPLIAVLFASCCKALCLDEGLEIDYRNFTAGQIDTVLYVRYGPGTAEPLDSQWKTLALPPTLPDTAHISVIETLLPGSDWQVYIPAVDKRYKVSDFELGKDRCNCGGGRYTVVRSYSLNGAPKQGSYLVLE